MSKHSPKVRSRFFTPLVWLGLYLLNLGLVLLFQFLFIHTLSAPVTVQTVRAHPAFRGCEVLDLAGEGAAGSVSALRQSSGFVLYRTALGETEVAQVQQNPYLPRFCIREDSAQPVPPGGEVTVALRDLFGTNEVVIEDQRRILRSSGSGFYWQYQAAKAVPLFWALLFLVVESTLPDLWRRFRKKRGVAPETPFPPSQP